MSHEKLCIGDQCLCFPAFCLIHTHHHTHHLFSLARPILTHPHPPSPLLTLHTHHYLFSPSFTYSNPPSPIFTHYHHCTHQHLFSVPSTILTHHTHPHPPSPNSVDHTHMLSHLKHCQPSSQTFTHPQQPSPAITDPHNLQKLKPSNNF